ncbi:hypothetical protein BGX24_000988 [Mortierella sp. AD032]|nr:hypothetical protein BGX24_000988 [Mortierella sp. AD032]
MQSQIPQPLSPDEYASPTSATPLGSGLKRKSINHDEVMDAIRAKVLRNAASGPSQQQKEQRDKPHRKSSGELNARRKPHPLNSSNNNNDSTCSSPDRSKRPATAATIAAAEAAPSTPQRTVSNKDKNTAVTSPSERTSATRKEDSALTYNRRISKQEDVDETLMSPHPMTRSPPASMSPPSSASRSSSSSPRMEPAKYVYQHQYQRQGERQEGRQGRNDQLQGSSDRERARVETISYSEDDQRSRYSMEHSRAERPSEVGGMY